MYHYGLEVVGSSGYSGLLYVRSGKKDTKKILKAVAVPTQSCQITNKTESRKIAEFLTTDGQLLLSAQQIAGPKQRGKVKGEVNLRDFAVLALPTTGWKAAARSRNAAKILSGSGSSFSGCFSFKKKKTCGFFDLVRIGVHLYYNSCTSSGC